MRSIENLGTVTNHELQPLRLSSPYGEITWQQIRGYWSLDEHGMISLGTDAAIDESQHQSLTLNPGGFAKMYRENGKTFVFGTGLSAPEPTARES